MSQVYLFFFIIEWDLLYYLSNMRLNKQGHCIHQYSISVTYINQNIKHLMRRRSGANFQQLLNKEWAILSRAEHQQIQNLYKKIELRNGGISFYDMINILKSLGFNINQQKKDKINRELTTKQIRVLDINIVLNQAAALKKEKDESGRGEISEQNQYLDAFVALGGNADHSGSVRKTTLIETIKKQFELTFDIESFIDSIPGDNLDYQAFCSIFEQDREKGEGRLASAASQRSLKSSDSARSLVLDERDFQKFMSQYDNEDN